MENTNKIQALIFCGPSAWSFVTFILPWFLQLWFSVRICIFSISLTGLSSCPSPPSLTLCPLLSWESTHFHTNRWFLITPNQHALLESLNCNPQASACDHLLLCLLQMVKARDHLLYSKICSSRLKSFDSALAFGQYSQ